MRPQTARLIRSGRQWWHRSLGGRGYTRVRELDLDTHALALCAQQVLCTAPLMVAMSAVLQRFTGRNMSGYVARFFGLHTEAGHDIVRLFGRTSDRISTPALVIGLVTAVALTTSVAAVQQRGFEMIWTLPRITGIRSYVRQLMWTPALAGFVVVLLGANRLGGFLDQQVMGVGAWATALLQALTTLGFYWWTQHWLLRGRVRWRALLPGSLAVAVLTIAAVRISRLIMDGQISWQVEAYGLLGAVFVLSVWLMVLSVLILGGVLFGALLVERRRNPERLQDEVHDSALTIPGLLSAELPTDSPDSTGEDPGLVAAGEEQARDA